MGLHFKNEKEYEEWLKSRGKDSIVERKSVSHETEEKTLRIVKKVEESIDEGDKVKEAYRLELEDQQRKDIIAKGLVWIGIIFILLLIILS